MTKQAKTTKATKTTVSKGAKLSKQEKAAQLELPGFRVVVRGTFGDKRVRRVKTVHAATPDAAAAVAEKDSKLTAGLTDMYVNVFDPVRKAA